DVLAGRSGHERFAAGAGHHGLLVIGMNALFHWDTHLRPAPEKFQRRRGRLTTNQIVPRTLGPRNAPAETPGREMDAEARTPWLRARRNIQIAGGGSHAIIHSTGPMDPAGFSQTGGHVCRVWRARRCCRSCPARLGSSVAR